MQRHDWKLIAAGALAALAAATARASLEGYMNHEALMDAVRSLDASSACAVMSLAASSERRDIPLLTLSSDPASADRKPALLIVAGIDGRFLVSTETAMRVARTLVENHADALDDMTVYVVPRLNPDAAERNLTTVTNGQIVSAAPIDNERDGVADEDGPADINGDGAITMMRRLSPPIDDPPTHVADPNEPRLLKKPDALKDERAIYSVYIEGLDADGDGLVAEDGVGGVDLDRNFMHLWPEHSLDAGSTQLSEPAALALARFVVDHPNIVMAITYGRHDNLINVPAGKAKDETGRAPRDLDGADVPLYKEVSDLFKETTEQSRAPSEDIAGSFHAWLYAHRGVPSFATVVWGRPDPSKDEPEEGKEESGDEGEDASDGASDGEGDAAKAPAGSAPAPGGEAQVDPISGTWSGSATVPEMGDIPLTFTLELAPDGSVTGTADSMAGTGQVTGRFDGSTLSIVASYGPEFSLPIELRVEGESMTGSTTTPDGAVATISAKRTSAPPAAGGAAAADSKAKKDDKKPADAEAAAWLAYSDKDRAGEGFIDWQPFDHPTLGAVEIGGFVWHFQINPPADDLDSLAARQTEFALQLITKRPQISAIGPTVVELAPGLYQIDFAVVNDGLMPTKTQMAVQNRAVHPTIVRISTPVERIVAGERVSRVWGVAGAGGRSNHQWIVREEPGGDITIDVTRLGFADQSYTVKAQSNPASNGGAQ